MKKIIFLAILFVAFTSVQAQFGVKAGLNIATFSGDDADEEGKKSKLGPYFGVFYNAKLSDMFSVQPEAVYSSQGAKYEESGFSGKYKLGYLNVTPLLRYNNPSGFFAGLGPQFGFLLSAEYEEDDSDEIDIKDELKGLDIALALAAGYEMKSGFGFYARFNLGLTSIVDEDDVDLKNSVFQFGLRYGFGGSKGDSKK